MQKYNCVQFTLQKGRAQTLYELNEPLVDQLLRQPPAFWLFALLVVFFPGAGDHLAQAVSSVWLGGGHLAVIASLVLVITYVAFLRTKFCQHCVNDLAAFLFVDSPTNRPANVVDPLLVGTNPSADAVTAKLYACFIDTRFWPGGTSNTGSPRDLP